MTRVIFIIKPCTTWYKGSTRFTNDRYGTRAPSSQINGQKPILVCCCPFHKSQNILQNKHLSISLCHSFFINFIFNRVWQWRRRLDPGCTRQTKMSEVVESISIDFLRCERPRHKQLSRDPSLVLFFCQKNSNGLTQLTCALIPY